MQAFIYRAVAITTLLAAVSPVCGQDLKYNFDSSTFPPLNTTWLTEAPPFVALPADPSPGIPAIPPHERAPLTADETTLVAGNNQFGLDIYGQLLHSAKPTDNILVSPFSISAALTMAYAGARGETADQMVSVLHYNLPNDTLHVAFGSLISDLTAPRNGYQLNVANRLFGQSDFRFNNQFLNVVSQNYGAPLEPTDFYGNPDGSRRHINDWVASQTNDKIKNLLPAGSVSADTRLVLTNAVYFKGDWKYKFDKSATRDDSFFAPAGATQVAMMHQFNQFNYTQQPGYQMLEMPYAGDDLSMVVLLPTARDGIANLEASLTPQMLDDGLQALRPTEVNVTLPKFTFDNQFKLGSILATMGMPDAFSDDANFSGMSDIPLKFSDVYHDTFVGVDEDGTEAAAATAVTVVMVTGAFYHPIPIDFTVDHPFLFALRDNHSGSLLFIGRVADPGKLTPAAAAVPEPAAFALLAIAFAATPSQRRRSITSRR